MNDILRTYMERFRENRHKCGATPHLCWHLP